MTVTKLNTPVATTLDMIARPATTLETDSVHNTQVCGSCLPGVLRFFGNMTRSVKADHGTGSEQAAGHENWHVMNMAINSQGQYPVPRRGRARAVV